MHAIIRYPHLKPSPTHQDARNRNVLPLVNQNEQIAGLFSDISHLICILVHSDRISLSNILLSTHTILTILQVASHLRTRTKAPQNSKSQKENSSIMPKIAHEVCYPQPSKLRIPSSVLSGNSSPLLPKRRILSLAFPSAPNDLSQYQPEVTQEID
jgi:hypothetical protein